MRRWARQVGWVLALVVGASIWGGVAAASAGNGTPAATVEVRGDALVSVSVHGGDVLVTVLPDWRTADYSTITVRVKDKVDVEADPPCLMYADLPDNGNN